MPICPNFTLSALQSVALANYYNQGFKHAVPVTVPVRVPVPVPVRVPVRVPVPVPVLKID